jgi:hypothetical protein
VVQGGQSAENTLARGVGPGVIHFFASAPSLGRSMIGRLQGWFAAGR